MLEVVPDAGASVTRLANFFARGGRLETAPGLCLSPRVRKLRIVIAALSMVWACQRAAQAQDAPAPEPPPNLQLQAALDSPAVKLSDAWMKYLDLEESKQLRAERPYSIGFPIVAAGIWTALAVYYQLNQNDAPGTLAMSGAAVANIGLLIVQLNNPDLYDTHAFDGWTRAANFLMAGVALSFVAAGDNCDRDCSFLAGTMGGAFALQALTFAAFQIFAPPVHVSQHYEEYRARLTQDKPQFALDVMRANESRARSAQYGTAASLAITGITAVVLATQLDRTTAQQMMASAGVVAFLGGLWSFLRAGGDLPSERMAAGQYPPQPRAF
jgi:hypothetical protein